MFAWHLWSWFISLNTFSVDEIPLGWLDWGAMLLKLGKGVLRASPGGSMGCGKLGGQEEEIGGLDGAHLVVSGKQEVAP